MSQKEEALRLKLLRDSRGKEYQEFVSDRKSTRLNSSHMA